MSEEVASGGHSWACSRPSKDAGVEACFGVMGGLRHLGQ